MNEIKSFDDFRTDNKSEYENTNQQLGITEDLWNTVNPETGMRFDIPMLNFLDPMYKIKYINYMKLKEEKPEEFERLMQWN